jgi:hypothetical protein
MKKRDTLTLALLGLVLGACAATQAENANDKEAYEEPEYTTGSMLPHKKADATKLDANAVADQIRHSAPATVMKNGG